MLKLIEYKSVMHLARFDAAVPADTAAANSYFSVLKAFFKLKTCAGRGKVYSHEYDYDYDYD